MIEPTCPKQTDRSSAKLSVVSAEPFDALQKQRAPRTEPNGEALQQAASVQVERDLRIAKVLRLRRAAIEDEVLSRARQHEEAYRIAGMCTCQGPG